MTLRQVLACLAGIALIVPSAYSFRCPSPSDSTHYEMWSWQDSNDEWNFCVRPADSLNSCELKGMRELKKRIVELPSGAVIDWINEAPGSGAKIGKYPSREVIRKIRAFAEKHHVTVEILSSGSLSLNTSRILDGGSDRNSFIGRDWSTAV
jgi:hypothetical protein